MIQSPKKKRKEKKNLNYQKTKTKLKFYYVQMYFNLPKKENFDSFYFIFFPTSRIIVITPADEHGDTAPHDVETSSLFPD